MHQWILTILYFNMRGVQDVKAMGVHLRSQPLRMPLLLFPAAAVSSRSLQFEVRMQICFITGGMLFSLCHLHIIEPNEGQIFNIHFACVPMCD